MEKKMSKKTLFKLLSITAFLAFLITYVIGMSGYYEYELSNKRVLTEEKMKEFEEDVKNNKDIDLNDYVVNTHQDYTNKFTKTVTSASLTLNKYLKKSIESVFKIINSLVEE